MNHHNTTNNNNGTRLFSQCPDWFPYHLALPSMNMSNTLEMECPDTIIVPISSGIFYGIYLIILVCCVWCLIWKRNSSQLKARSIIVLSFGLVLNFSLVSLILVRYMVGKNDFPCFLFSLTIFFLGPCFILPSNARGIKLIIQYRINLLRTKRISSKPNHSNTVSQVKDTKEDVSMTTTTDDKEDNATSNIQVNDMKGDVAISDNQSESGSSFYQESKTMKILSLCNRILQSRVFYLVFSIIFAISHLIMWLSAGLIEDHFYSTKRFFNTNRSIFSVGGCYTASGTSIVLASYLAFYLLLDVIVSIVCLTIDNDTFSMKKETLLLTLIRVLVVLIYIICNQVAVLKVFGRIIPFFNALFVYCAVEIVVTIIVPSIKDSVQNRRSMLQQDAQQFESEIETVLNDPEYFIILLDFARRSHCPEGVLFFKEVQHYKKLINKLSQLENGTFQKVDTIKNQRMRISQFVHQVVHVYLSEGGINELNIANLKVKKNELVSTVDQIEKQSDFNFPLNLFDVIMLDSMLTLMELYSRLKQHNRTIQEFSESWNNNLLQHLQQQQLQNKSSL